MLKYKVKSTISHDLFSYIGSLDCNGYLGKTVWVLMISFSFSAQQDLPF